MYNVYYVCIAELEIVEGSEGTKMYCGMAYYDVLYLHLKTNFAGEKRKKYV